ncbi:helix-turn-helix domain-containing protein [Agrobacterium rhizogenes]|nr:helix-turn-helix domain-containing protein [Rhizobium rhizogenes]
MQDNLDLLMGANAIGQYLGLGRRQVYNLIYAGELPTFHIGSTVAARKGKLAGWLAEKEAAAA